MDQPNVVTMQPMAVSGQPRPKDHLMFSISNLLCCCMPIGIIALIYSIKARNATAQSDWITARKHSRTALNLNIAALVIVTIVSVVFGVIYYYFGLYKQ